MGGIISLHFLRVKLMILFLGCPTQSKPIIITLYHKSFFAALYCYKTTCKTFSSRFSLSQPERRQVFPARQTLALEASRIHTLLRRVLQLPFRLSRCNRENLLRSPFF